MHRRLVASALVLALTVAVACGSDDDGDAAAPTTTERPGTTTEAPVAVDPLPDPTTTTTAAPLGPPVAASNPADLAAQLARVEQAIRNPAVTVTERLGHEQQVAYRRLVDNPGWKDEVLARVPAELRPIIEANYQAGAGLRAMVKPRTSLPDQWRIVAPAPAAELRQYYAEAEAATGVPWYYLAAINLVETRMGRIRGTSSAGAQGPMQFMPATWEQYGNGGDIQSPRDSIHAAARLLKANGAPERIENAVWNYNHDDRYVRAVVNHAHLMRDDPRAFDAFYHWQVYYVTVDGDRWLPVGYPEVPSPPPAP